MNAVTTLILLVIFADDARLKQPAKDLDASQRARIASIVSKVQWLKQPAKESEFPDDFVHLQPKPGSPAWVPNFIKQAENDRLYWMQEMEAMIVMERARAKTARKDNERNEAMRLIEEHTDRLNRMKTKDLTFIDAFEYAANLPESRPLVHEQVVFFTQKKPIVQVLGKQTCLIKVQEPIVTQQQVRGKTVRRQDWRETLAIVRGVSTDGRVDDREYEFPGLLLVSGTKTYVTPHGTSKTVFVLEPIDAFQYVEKK